MIQLLSLTTSNGPALTQQKYFNNCRGGRLHNPSSFFFFTCGHTQSLSKSLLALSNTHLLHHTGIRTVCNTGLGKWSCLLLVKCTQTMKLCLLQNCRNTDNFNLLDTNTKIFIAFFFSFHKLLKIASKLQTILP